jgi:uncharacterized protein involved in response to NO
VVAIGAWAWILASGRAPFGGLPPHLWHGHEMLFGFIGAAIAGFLLTAVPSWTGSRGFAGAPLVLLSALWLAGRIAFAGAAFLPWALVAAAELAFLPLLAFLIGRSLIRERNRNFPMLVIVSVLWGIDAWCLGALAAADFGQAGLALRTGIGVVLLLVTIIGGRIVPAFTANALRARGIAVEVMTRKPVEAAAVGAMAMAVLVDALAPGGRAAGLVALFATLAQALRLSGWRSLRSSSREASPSPTRCCSCRRSSACSDRRSYRRRISGRSRRRRCCGSPRLRSTSWCMRRYSRRSGRTGSRAERRSADGQLHERHDVIAEDVKRLLSHRAKTFWARFRR